MATVNTKLCLDFVQSKFHHEIINFFNHIKELYPKEQEITDSLMAKYLTISGELMSFDKIEEALSENLSKSKALITAALTNEDFSDLEKDIIYHYFWALETFITKAYDLVVNKQE